MSRSVRNISVSHFICPEQRAISILVANTGVMSKPRTLDVTLFQSIIYYTVRSPKLEQWLADESIQEGLRPMLDSDHIDLDPTFNFHVDEDFDHRSMGVSKHGFCSVYLDWIQYCASRRDKVQPAFLCFAFNILYVYCVSNAVLFGNNWLIMSGTGTGLAWMGRSLHQSNHAVVYSVHKCGTLPLSLNAVIWPLCGQLLGFKAWYLAAPCYLCFQNLDSGKESWLVSLCFGLSLLGRRALGTASHNNASARYVPDRPSQCSPAVRGCLLALCKWRRLQSPGRQVSSFRMTSHSIAGSMLFSYSWAYAHCSVTV